MTVQTIPCRAKGHPVRPRRNSCSNQFECAANALFPGQLFAPFGYAAPIAAVRSPSPQPSPLGRGSTVACQWTYPRRLDGATIGPGDSLSLRERVGVRGNGPPAVAEPPPVPNACREQGPVSGVGCAAQVQNTSKLLLPIRIPWGLVWDLDAWQVRSPSPLPSPSGRGCHAGWLWKFRSAPDSPAAGRRFSLSLRERAGVRGNRLVRDPAGTAWARGV